MELNVRQSYKYFMVGEYDKMYSEYITCSIIYRQLKTRKLVRKSFKNVCENALKTWGVSFDRNCEKWLEKCLEIGLTRMLKV